MPPKTKRKGFFHQLVHGPDLDEELGLTKEHRERAAEQRVGHEARKRSKKQYKQQKKDYKAQRTLDKGRNKDLAALQTGLSPNEQAELWTKFGRVQDDAKRAMQHAVAGAQRNGIVPDAAQKAGADAAAEVWDEAAREQAHLAQEAPEEAGPDVSLVRPPRVGDDFATVLSAVRESKNKDRAQGEAELEAAVQEDRATGGLAYADPGRRAKLAKKLAKEFEEQRHQARKRADLVPLTPTLDPDDGDLIPQRDDRALKEKILKRALEAQKDGASGPPSEQDLAKAAKKVGPAKGLAVDALDAVGDVGKLMSGAGAAGAKVLRGAGLAPSATDVSTKDQLAEALAGFSVFTGLGKVLDKTRTFIDQLLAVARGGTDPGVKRALAAEGATLLGSLASTAKGAMKLATAVVEHSAGQEAGAKFAGALESGEPFAVTNTTGAALSGGAIVPGLGIAVSALGLISDLFNLHPAYERWNAFDELISAKTDDRVGAAAAGRLRRVAAKNLYGFIFSASKNTTNMAAHISDLAAAGGMGAGTAVRAVVTLSDMLKGMAEAVLQLREDDRAATAKKDYAGTHGFGTAEHLVRSDPGTAADVLVHAAQRRGDREARKVLKGLGIEEAELGTMLHHEIQAKVMDKLRLVPDPTTIDDKLAALLKPLKGITTGEPLKAAAAAAGAAAAGVVGAVSDTLTGADHHDVTELKRWKDEYHYNDEDARGAGHDALQKIRPMDDIEKSYAKVRAHILRMHPGRNLDDLPYSHREQELRAKYLRGADERLIDPALRDKVDTLNARDLNKLSNERRKALTALGPDHARDVRVRLEHELDFLWRAEKRARAAEQQSTAAKVPARA